MKNKIKEWGVFLLVLLILICFYPYEFNSVYFHFLPRKAYYTVAIFLVPTLLFAISGKKRSIGQVYLYPFVIAQLLGFALVYVAQGFYKNIFSTGSYILYSFLLVIIVDKNYGLLSFIKKYNIWILVMAVLGTFAWALVTFVGLSPISVVTDRADERDIFNYGLTFSKTIQYSFRTIRYSGFFDEPGAMGYWGMFALLFNKVFVKSHRMEWLLIVFVSFTFSMGFFLQLLVYLIVFNVNVKNLGRTIFLLFTVAIGIVALYSTKGTDYDGFYQFTIGRVENILDAADSVSGALENDNRAEMTELAKKEFAAHPLFGSSTNEYILDNIYEPLARYGIIGSAFILFPFLSLLLGAIKRKDYIIVKMMVVLFISFFHRPFHNLILYYFMLYCLITMVKDRWRTGVYRNHYSVN